MHPERPLAAAAAGITFATYLIGSGRAFGYDAAVTMHSFVAGTPSDALTRQVVFNNHPLFSLIEGAVADLTGSTGEVMMRVAPALFAAAAVGLLVWRLGARWGWRSGLVAGAVLAAHPTLVPLARDARGYSLAVLAIVVMGLAVLDLESPWLFAVAGAIGIGTHLYVLIPVVALVAYLAVEGRVDRRWRVASGVGILGGLVVYIRMFDQMGRGGRVFRPSFPVDAGWALLGGGLVAAVAFAALLVASVVGVRIGWRWVVVGAVLAAGVIGPWLLGPTDLYPRFIFWAVPVLAALVALAVRRRPGLLPVAALAALACLVPQLDTWGDDEIPNRELARHVGPMACGVSWPSEAVVWYVDLRSGEACPTAALLFPEATPTETARARARWPVECWSTDGAEVRGRTAEDCLAAPH
jgi:hypothetical protein